MLFSNYRGIVTPEAIPNRSRPSHIFPETQRPGDLAAALSCLWAAFTFQEIATGLRGTSPVFDLWPTSAADEHTAQL